MEGGTGGGYYLEVFGVFLFFFSLVFLVQTFSVLCKLNFTFLLEDLESPFVLKTTLIL